MNEIKEMGAMVGELVAKLREISDFVRSEVDPDPSQNLTYSDG